MDGVEVSLDDLKENNPTFTGEKQELLESVVVKDKKKTVEREMYNFGKTKDADVWENIAGATINIVEVTDEKGDVTYTAEVTFPNGERKDFTGLDKNTLNNDQTELKKFPNGNTTWNYTDEIETDEVDYYYIKTADGKEIRVKSDEVETTYRIIDINTGDTICEVDYVTKGRIESGVDFVKVYGGYLVKDKTGNDVYFSEDDWKAVRTKDVIVEEVSKYYYTKPEKQNNTPTGGGTTPSAPTTPSTPSTPASAPATVVIDDAPVALAAAPVAAPVADGPAVLGARRTATNATDAAVLGASRGEEFAVLGKRRRPATGDSVAMLVWGAVLAVAVGGALVSGSRVVAGKKRED